MAPNVATQSQRDALGVALLAAYDRFLEKPEKVDPGCPAKTAIIDALRRIDFYVKDFDEEDFFLQAARYRQPESVFGGSVDAAAELRVHAVFALLDMGSRQAFPTLVDLLADEEKACRAGAARALAATGQDTAKLLLRLKVHQGDSDAQVLGECLLSFLEVDGADAVPLVLPYLNGVDVDRRLEAAIALGTSREPEAFQPLKHRALVPSDAEERRIMFTSLALLQLNEATEFLLGQVSSREVPITVAALHALSHVRDQNSVRESLKKLALEKAHPDIQAACEQYFGESM
jgi:HEAT repeat protein